MRLIKIIVACALVAALVYSLDWDKLPDHIAALNAIIWLAALVILIEIPVNATKWSWALRLHDVRVPWFHLMRAGCIAYFLNNFLPSGIGGDVYRVYKTLPAAGEEKSRAVSAVIVERLVGLIAMLCNAAIGAFFLSDAYPFAKAVEIAAIVGFAVFVVGAIAVYLGWFKAPVRILQKRAFLAPFISNLQRIARLRIEWVPLLVISFGFQLLAAAVVYFTFMGIGEPTSFSAALLITAAAGVAAVIPISISGIGVVEGSIAGTAILLGIDNDTAVLAALVLRLLVVPISALCGTFYFFERDRGPPKTAPVSAP